MPKTVVRYECEICGLQYSKMNDAIDCEERGYGREYPIGCIYGDHTKGAFYKNITFAVAENRIGKGIRAHLNDGCSWACRDNGSGDSLGNQRCGSSHLDLTYYNDKKLDQNAPHFKRMVAWLKNQNIPVTIWNGKEAVPYEEWINEI